MAAGFSLGFRKPINAWRWIGVSALGEIGWFSLVWPMVPATALGFAVEAVFPLLLAAYCYLVFRAAILLGGVVSNRAVLKSLQVVLALSIGVAIILAAYVFREFMGANFQYR